MAVNLHRWYLIAFVLLAVAGFWLWHKNQLALARADERVKAQDVAIQQAQATIGAAEQARQKAIADLEAERKKPATVQTVIKQLPAPLPAGSEVKVEELPDAPTPQVVMSGDAQTNLNFIRDQLISHQECDTNLDACNQKLAAQGKELVAAVNQRDIWKQTAKGGSKWQRFGKAVKVSLCAGAGAGLGFLAKQKSTGAAIGGAAGAATCEALF